MHELYLFGLVPEDRRFLVLSVLAGFAAMQPRRNIEHHVMFKPARGPLAFEGPKGGSQTVTVDKVQQPYTAGKELFYWRIVKDLEDDDFGRTEPAADEDTKKRLAGW